MNTVFDIHAHRFLSPDSPPPSRIGKGSGMNVMGSGSGSRVFTEVTFGIPRNTEYYTEVTLIPRNSA